MRALYTHGAVPLVCYSSVAFQSLKLLHVSGPGCTLWPVAVDAHAARVVAHARHLQVLLLDSTASAAPRNATVTACTPFDAVAATCQFSSVHDAQTVGNAKEARENANRPVRTAPSVLQHVVLPADLEAAAAAGLHARAALPTALAQAEVPRAGAGSVRDSRRRSAVEARLFFGGSAGSTAFMDRGDPLNSWLVAVRDDSLRRRCNDGSAAHLLAVSVRVLGLPCAKRCFLWLSCRTKRA